MKLRFVRLPLVAAGALLVGACADGGVGGEAGDGIAFTVAPLDLPGITDACYALTVYNSTVTLDATTTVWSAPDICSSDYGDGVGAISYVGTCDASAATNTAELVLQDIYAGGAHDTGGTALVDGDDYVNPCPASQPCQLEAPCEENADTFVEFNLTLMRSAEQGFFDVAVNFEDIFCSAKMDCEYADGTDIELLFNDAGERASTAVMGFACTAGPGSDTKLVMSDTYIVCDDGATNVGITDPSSVPTRVVAQYSPANPQGNLTPSTNPNGPQAHPDGIFASAVYQGREQLADADGSLGKVYSNMAIGFEDRFFDLDEDGAADRGCYAIAWASATDSVNEDLASNDATTSPTVRFVVPLNPADGGGLSPTLSCGQHGLNGAASGVATVYDSIADEVCFENVVDGNFAGSDIDVAHYRQNLLGTDVIVNQDTFSDNVDSRGVYGGPLQGLPTTVGGIEALANGDEATTCLPNGVAIWGQEGAEWAPANFSAAPVDVTVTVCVGGAVGPDLAFDPNGSKAMGDGYCDAGDAPLPDGIPFFLQPRFTMPGTPGAVDPAPLSGDFMHVAVSSGGQVTFTGVEPGNYLLNEYSELLFGAAATAAGWPADHEDAFCGPSLTFDFPHNWPQRVTVAGTQALDLHYEAVCHDGSF